VKEAMKTSLDKGERINQAVKVFALNESKEEVAVFSMTVSVKVLD